MVTMIRSRNFRIRRWFRRGRGWLINKDGMAVFYRA